MVHMSMSQHDELNFGWVEWPFLMIPHVGSDFALLHPTVDQEVPSPFMIPHPGAGACYLSQWADEVDFHGFFSLYFSIFYVLSFDLLAV